MIWTRLLLALVVAAAIGFGVFFIALGVLPESAPSVPLQRSESEVDWLYLDTPELQEEKHRLAIASGIGCAASVMATFGLLYAKRRWISPPAAQTRA